MSTKTKIFCLDANVLIEAWQKYYSPKFCPEYWDVLNELGDQGRIFIPEMVYEEISKWLKNSKIPVRKINVPVTRCLQSIYSTNPMHKKLVDNTKARSLADPWVIAHAINEKATVVTKEEKVTALNSNKIKIPNVCDNMSIPWINDFQLIEVLNIQFTCKLKKL